MAVSRCPACDANLDGSGADENPAACPKCGAPLGELAPAKKPSSGRARPMLLATGVVMILGLFLYANPAFGSKAAKWPWQHFVESSSMSRKADLLLWVLVGGLAIYFGSGRGGRHRMAWLMAPLVLLATRCYGQGAAFTAVRSNEPTLGWFAAITCLGAAGLVLATSAVNGRGAARTLAWIGALGVLVAYSVTFGQTGHSLLWHYTQDFKQVTESLFRGAESEAGTVTALWKQWWGKLVPLAVQVLAGLCAVALALLPASRRDALARGLGIALVALLVTRWIEPLVATFVYERKALEAGGLSSYALLIGRTLFDAGLGLWLIAASTVASVVRDYGAPALEGSAGSVPLSHPSAGETIGGRA